MAPPGIARDIVQEERRAFSERFREALTAAGYGEKGATDIMRMYNYHCPLKVSSHAVHKWLSGESVPTQQRLVCIAQWLRCDSGWLRYGTGERMVASGALTSDPDADLLRDLSLLDGESKALVRVLVSAMLKKR